MCHDVLIFDECLVSQALQSLLQNPTRRVSTCSQADVIEKLQNKPDIFLADVGLLAHAASLLSISKAAGIHTILMASRSDFAILTARAYRSAQGFFLKEQSMRDLCSAMDCVVQGHRYVAPRVLEYFDVSTRKRKTGNDHQLTDRQLDVLPLIAAGKATKEIASLLSLSPKTAEFHRISLMDHLGIRTVAELTSFAISAGFLPPV